MKYVNYFLLLLLIVLTGLKFWLQSDLVPLADVVKVDSIETVDDVYEPMPWVIKEINGVEFIESRSQSGHYGGKIIISTIGEGPKTFNPWESKDATSSTLADYMYDGLVTTDVYTGKIIPKLAKSIDIDKSGMVYTIKLRRGLKWSDGRSITVDDVMFTWDDIIFAGLGNTSTMDSLVIDGKLPKIERVDAHTVRFITPKPFAPFLRMLSVPIAPKHKVGAVVKKGSDAFRSYLSTNTKPSEFVVSGSFILSEYVPAQRVVYKRNPNYSVVDADGQKLPYLDNLVVLIVGDFNNELLKFEAGEIDLIDLRGSNVSKYKESEKSSDYKIYNLGPSTSTLFLAFNMNTRKNDSGKYHVNPIKQVWFADVAFRKAVDYAIDRDNIVFNIARGLGSPLFTPEALSSIYLNTAVASGHKKDIAVARKILVESGFVYDSRGRLFDKDGNRVVFDMLTNAGNTERESIGVMMKQDLAEIGIDVNFKPTEFNSLVNKASNTLDWETMIMGLTGNPLEPHTGKNVFNSFGTLHLFNKRNSNFDDRLPFEKRLDEIFEKASLELDFTERKVLYDEYQQLMYDNAPFIYIYSPLRVTAIRKKFANIHPTELGGITHNLEEIYINK